jgi:hypothetical protein
MLCRVRAVNTRLRTEKAHSSRICGKIDAGFDVLRDGGMAFMAAAIGRLTGRPGVCLVISSPGMGNLVTGAATATTEGDPMVAIGGVVPLADTLKQTNHSVVTP